MEAYGRVTYLEPMKWVNNWPVVGIDKDNDGTGEPVATYKKPGVGRNYPVATPQTSDEFNELKVGLQWQWQANPKSTWMYMTDSTLRLYAQPPAKGHKNFWDVPNILMQKFPANQFVATTKFTFTAMQAGDRTGFIVMGANYAYLSLQKMNDGLHLAYATCIKADQGKTEQVQEIKTTTDSTFYFRVTVDKGAKCQFSYSTDGRRFANVGSPFHAVPGRWIGAKLGLFCTSETKINDSGYADFDWFRIGNKH
jgi:beta-xylosidase